MINLSDDVQFLSTFHSIFTIIMQRHKFSYKFVFFWKEHLLVKKGIHMSNTLCHYAIIAAASFLAVSPSPHLFS